MRVIAYILVMLSLLVGPVAAGSIISDFEDGTLQGWVATGDVAGVTNPGSGGNPGGFLRMVDQASGDVCWILAPAHYLGNWHAKSSLSADLTQVSFSGGQFMTVEFHISGPGGHYHRVFPERPPLGLWRTYGTALDEASWIRDSGDWASLLDNVTELRISMEFINGAETNGLDSVALTESTEKTTIGLAKQMQDGSTARVDGVVSRLTDECMYIQSEDRAAGIRVKNSFLLSIGDRIDIQGDLATDHNERVLEHATVLSSTPGSPPAPLFVTNKELGGIGTTIADPTLGDSQSLKETGLLVRVSGFVSDVGADGSFRMNDGSSGGVAARAAAGSAPPIRDSYVAITGVSSSDGAVVPAPAVLVAAPDDCIYLKLPLGQNLILNGGAEAGGLAGDGATIVRPIAHWTPSPQFTLMAYGGDVPLSQSVAIGGGRNLFMGGYGPGAEATQDIDLSSLASRIDAGGLTATLSGYLGAWQYQGDNARVTATFYDASNTGLGAAQIGPQTGSYQSMIFHTGSAAVPVGSRRVQVTIVFTRTEGSWCDAYADNLSLVISE